mgnify:CR=1 FL=1
MEYVNYSFKEIMETINLARKDNRIVESDTRSHRDWVVQSMLPGITSEEIQRAVEEDLARRLADLTGSL